MIKSAGTDTALSIPIMQKLYAYLVEMEDKYRVEKAMQSISPKNSGMGSTKREGENNSG